MLDFYFTSAVRLRQLRQGPLADHLEILAAEFQRNSYSELTARRMLSIIGQFNRYISLTGVDIGDVDEEVTARFLADAAFADRYCNIGSTAMRRLLSDLRHRGIIAPPPAVPPHPFSSTLDAFDRHQRDVRGLAQSTRRHSVVDARIFIDWLRERYGQRALTRISGADVLDFVTERLKGCKARSSRGHVCSNTRVFLRFLQASGAITSELSQVVPKVSTPRLSSLPSALPWEKVQELINGIDSTHPDGLRDKAILLLLATLGLRAGEVLALEFDHVNWRIGELRLPRTKSRRERVLPLLQELGAALADYVLHGRPAVDVQQVFLRHGVRPGPMKSSNTITYIVRRHLVRAGIQHHRPGAHLLRHSLATRLVDKGVPIKSVADVLGHVSIDTTAIYTKVDTTTLSSVALRFPGGEQ
jgi:site-specific recombinase XerD